MITGASGSVGSGLVQLAHILGAHVVAIAGSGKEERTRQVGADIVVTRDTENFHAAVSGAAGEQDIDVVADVVGGLIFPDLLRLLRKQGRYITAGALAGPIVSLDLRTVYLKHLEIIGSTLGTHQEFADLVSYIERGRLKTLLAKTDPHEDIKQAQSDFKEKRHFGK